MSRAQEDLFGFAIAQQRRRPLSRRFYSAVCISLLGHLLSLLILIENPQLLGPGLKTWLRLPVFSTKTVTREPAWRMAALLGKGGRMDMPPSDVLKKNTYDWNAHREGAPSPPIRVKWGGELADGRKVDKPTPAVKPAPGTQEPKPPEVAGNAAPKQEGQPGNPAGTPPGETAGKGVTVSLPPPQAAEPRQIPKKPPETAGLVSPSGIPGPDRPGSTPVNTAKPAAQGKPAAQVFENEQKAIQSEGTGFFGVGSYPIGEYAELIIERIKGNWYIPSNLRKSQGRTTVVFFIEKDGRYSNAHIVTPSGSSSLDLAALNAIIGSDPFPPLPKGFPGDRVGAKFVFAYNERQ
jgi:TonB family protein